MVAVALPLSQSDYFEAVRPARLEALSFPRRTFSPDRMTAGVPARAQILHRRRVLRRRRLMAGALGLILAFAFGVGALVALQAGLGSSGGGPLTTTGTPAVSGASAGVAAAATAFSAQPAVARVWVVRPGDTLWSIVEASGVKGDPRPVVDRLAARNWAPVAARGAYRASLASGDGRRDATAWGWTDASIGARRLQ